MPLRNHFSFDLKSLHKSNPAQGKNENTKYITHPDPGRKRPKTNDVLRKRESGPFPGPFGGSGARTKTNRPKLQLS